MGLAVEWWRQKWGDRQVRRACKQGGGDGGDCSIDQMPSRISHDSRSTYNCLCQLMLFLVQMLLTFGKEDFFGEQTYQHLYLILL
uniref:Uncharacterized protein n=1 Tax=Physcomitrium patens TaxID=3218 RepID=A0A2K1KFU9_PHYPA|nr:hypothetical protein PHYPA_009034 [Physcomitrium patens]